MSDSFCSVAEELVRSGASQTLVWEGVELSPHLQPVFSVARESCVGYEGLIRARDAEGHSLSPSKLFAQAFSMGRGVQLDWICRALHMRNFARVDPGDRKLFLNVHAVSAVQDTNGAEEFSDLIGYYGLSPRRVCVEVLEDGGADEAMLRKVIAAYRELGATIAMDDFGLGRSNFDRIVSLRPDLVKMDRAILVAAVGDSKARSMLPAIVELLHEAGSQVAVEGIESVDEALIAMESGAELVQGHFFGAPGGPALADESFGCGALARLAALRLRPSPVPVAQAAFGMA